MWALSRKLRQSRPVFTGPEGASGAVEAHLGSPARAPPSVVAARMGGVELERAAWIVVVLACVVTALILLLRGYVGYGVVTAAVALSAFINLF
jgi:hypothetical protein